MSGKCPKMSKKCSKHVQQMSKKCLKHVRKIAGKLPENCRKIAGKLLENGWKMAGKWPKHVRNMSVYVYTRIYVQQVPQNKKSGRDFQNFLN